MRGRTGQAPSAAHGNVDRLGQAGNQHDLSVVTADPRLSTLDAQFTAWARDTAQETPGPVLRRGVVWWTRLHGLLNLEIEGHFASMGFDRTLLYDAEVETLLDG